jgi:hypothetical protein
MLSKIEMEEALQQLLEKYPFFAIIRYSDIEYVCIVQNQDVDVTTIYDYNTLKTDDHKKLFLELANQWWWESNRMIPINVFLKQDWNQFRYCAKTLITKECEIIAGHAVRLHEIAGKRTKRKMIQLVRKTN